MASYSLEHQFTELPPWMQQQQERQGFDGNYQHLVDTPSKPFGHEIKSSKFADVLQFIIQGQQLSVNNPYNREHSQVRMIALSSQCPCEKVHPAEHREASADGLSSDDERFGGDVGVAAVFAAVKPARGGGHVRSNLQVQQAPLSVPLPQACRGQSARGEVFHYRPIPYARLPCDFPLPIVFGHSCASALKRNAVRLKIGGVCGDLPPVVMANIIYVVCDVVVAGCDMFTANKGRCCVWARTQADAIRIHECFHHRMWCGPAEIGYAVMCKSAEGAQHFETRLRAATRTCGSLPFPTHLMTVEFWQDEPPQKAASCGTASAVRQRPSDGTDAAAATVPDDPTARRKKSHRGNKATMEVK